MPINGGNDFISVAIPTFQFATVSANSCECLADSAFGYAGVKASVQGNCESLASSAFLNNESIGIIPFTGDCS